LRSRDFKQPPGDRALTEADIDNIEMQSELHQIKKRGDGNLFSATDSAKNIASVVVRTIISTSFGIAQTRRRSSTEQAWATCGSASGCIAGVTIRRPIRVRRCRSSARSLGRALGQSSERFIRSGMAQFVSFEPSPRTFSHLTLDRFIPLD